MLFLATHIGIWLLVAFAFGLVIGWFLWGRWVGIDMNRDYSLKASTGEGEGAAGGSISVLSDSLLKTQRELERCQQSLAQAEARLGESEIRFEPKEDRAGVPYADTDSADTGVAEAFDVPLSGNGETVEIERDDLKKIYGIGPVIERKLGELDITTYRQIALLSPEEIAIVNDHINYFSGRIERDGWLESARELHEEKYGEPI